jgi:hypothetical protein
MRISIVIPVCNEEENVVPLAREIHRALADFRPFEIIFVDDGSTDGTVAALLAAQAQGMPELRLLRHSKRSGQSAAVCSGIRAASAEWIATTFLGLPRFDHMHRFLPALFLNAGSEVISVPVRHRARTHGKSKYGLRNRLWVGIVDLFGVRWILKRNPPRPKVVEQGIERQDCE